MSELASRWFHFRAKGHVNVTARHRTTIEITKEETLTPRGDCIIGVSSEASASSLPDWLRDELRNPNNAVLVVLCSSGLCDAVIGHGDPRITASNNMKIIIRKSDYVEGSTIMVRSNKAAADLNRELISRLAHGDDLHVYITYLPLITSNSHKNNI
ncbi:hypothetical protein ASAC_0390 [Acidilobus saccharovorans 345-15]|uniref:DUF371 domain-containing protein n=1 Tax=Acidilobus saccharovorans (strain DSM 16705 / JCM 18335 / VKM B-2471 / 345-15) TaxID=666510 RepID=D9Q0F9_ACIS3|nr:DUF371 domain-containing protein [Acidilobus saccharovorans]ADL18797.1 hypothetical protein ASAC_0390 [Acidilobus saccharovorans 345-15]